MVMPRPEFIRTEQRFQDSPDLTPEKKRKAIRQFFGAARQVSTDSQGRIIIPEEYCAEFKLAGAIVFVGSSRRFEIWNKERYAEVSAADSADYEEAANAIGL